MNAKQARMAVALALSGVVHAGFLWIFADGLPASAAPARRAVSVSLTPAAPRAVLESIAPAATAAAAPAEIQPIAPPPVAVVDQPDAVLAARAAAPVEPLDARPVEILTSPPAELLDARAVRARKPGETLHARVRTSSRTTNRVAAVATAADRRATEGRARSGREASTSAAVAARPGADRRAQPASGNAPPEYPWRARTRGQQGRVVLSVWVSADGAAERLAVAQSSGHAALDRAAVDAVERWRFEPARRSGVDTASILHLPVIFRLED